MGKKKSQNTHSPPKAHSPQNTHSPHKKGGNSAQKAPFAHEQRTALDDGLSAGEDVSDRPDVAVIQYWLNHSGESGR